ncbi:RNA polymerase II associated protein 1 [Mortierella sp. AD094]|nr:RNA polymerase II associated protein 1 [Mortierella sp. AD094]
MNPGSANDERRRIEHESVIRQRRQAPETEDDLLAMQEEFLKANDRPAAAAVRVRPPTVAGSASSTKTTVQDEDDDDMPPPLEKDVVSLNSDELPLSPPTVSASSSKLRAGSRFLQDRANKGPRTHFQTPTGERFEINLDDDIDGNNPSSEVETEEETRRRLNNAGPSMGQILHEVLEKPVREAVAPQVATTTPGSLAPNTQPTKGGFKGKSLFAKRLAEAQSNESTAQSTTEPTSNSTGTRNQDLPVSAAYKSFMSRADNVNSPKKDVAFSNLDDLVPLKPTTKTSATSTNIDGHETNKKDLPLHSVLKKSTDTPHGTLMEQIDEENKRKLSTMSQEEIEEERAELLRNLNPELVKKLMKRNNVQRRVSFSEGIKVEDKVVNIHNIRIAHNDSNFQAKRHEEEEGDHPLTLKKRYFADVPAEPEKLEWMGIEGVENTDDGTRRTPGKSVAPGPQPYTVNEADPPAAHYRFDFSGMIVEGKDTPIHMGLHHHGMDPTKAGYTLSELLHLIRSTVPSQRILPLNIVAKVLQNCRKSDYGSFEVRAGILRWLIDTLRAPVYIRAALDDKTDSGIVAAVNALYAWTTPQANLGEQEDIWESLDHLDRGYERINLGFKYQSITRFANMELKPDSLQASQEQGTETEDTIAAHAILASKDPVDGLLAMNIIPRLRYLLSVCQLPVFTNAQILDILLTVARSNAGAAKRIFECEGLISALVRQYGAITWPSEKSDLELSCTIKAISILDVVVRSSKKIASAVIEEGHLEPLLRFLVLTPEATVESKLSFSIQTQVLKLFRSLAAYGLYCNVLGDNLQSHLIQDLAQSITERSKTDLAPTVKSFLSRKLSMLFQLVTAWTHAAADVHRTIPEHSLCWAQAAAFLDLALEGVSHWKQEDQMAAFDTDHALLVSSAIRYISTWARYLPTNPPDNEQILGRVWEALQLKDFIKSDAFRIVHERLSSIMQAVPELTEVPLPHVGVTMSNPNALSRIAPNLFEVSLSCEYLGSHLTTMFYLARLTSAPAFILKDAVDTLVSESVFGLVEKVTKFELAIQDQIPTALPPWMAFISRHGVYFIAHWLTAMDVLVYQQDPDNSSHIKLTFFPLFQVTALSLLQIIPPGDEFLSHEVLLKNLFNPRVLDKLLSHNTNQITVVKRILEPLYLQCFVKSDLDLKQSQSLWSHDGRGIKSLVVDYGRITGQPLFNWLFHPIELLFKSKLTYVEESGALIAATSVVHCTFDLVYSLLQTLDGISFELIYMAALKILSLEGEKEPPESTDGNEDEDRFDRAPGSQQEAGEEAEEEEEEEEDGFMDPEVDSTINKLLDHFSTRGDCSLVRDDSQGQSTLSEKTLSLLTTPLPFSQFMKNFMENSFTTGSLLRYQPTAARLLFPAMAISSELQLLIWQESFNFLGSVTTSWEGLDCGTLRGLITDDLGHVTTEVLKHYLKAVVSGRVIKQRNPVLYWIAVHHLARVAFGPIPMPLPPRGGSRSRVAPPPEDSNQDRGELSVEDAAALEERRVIAKAIITGTKSDELIRDWIQYDGRNYEQSPSTVSALSKSLAALNGTKSTSTSSSTSATGLSSSTSASVIVDTNVGAYMSEFGSPTSPMVKSPSRPLSLLSTSASFPVIGSSDYINYDNILAPPECFRERRQLMIVARKTWIKGVVDESGLARVEDAIQATTPVAQVTHGGGGAGTKPGSIYGGPRW